MNPAENDKMLPAERRAALSLALVYVFRMMGLFMVLPVLSLHVDSLSGADALLIGVAIGVYGLTQALLQVPFGLMSDRFGRKPLIVGGLVLFAAGSVVAALADDIWLLIAGRALQGAGAIAAVVMALAADLSRDSQRTKVMAIIGASIGGAFLLSLMVGPLISSWIGVSGLFWFTALLALISIVMVVWRVPTPISKNLQHGFKWDLLKSVATDSNLIKLDISIFTLHGVLSAVFVVVPFMLRDVIGMDSSQHWQMYLPVMVLSLVFAVPVIRKTGRENTSTTVLRSSIIVLLISVVMIGAVGHLVWGMAVALVLFFAAFNIMEASLPAFISKLAPVDFKGTAMGVYSTSQFAGTFVGSICAGWLMGAKGEAQVLFFVAGAIGVWLLLMLSKVKVTSDLQSCALEINSLDPQSVLTAFEAFESVKEVVVASEDNIVYLRYTGSTDQEKEFASCLASL